MLFEMAFVSNQTTGLDGFDVFNFHTNSSGSLTTAIEWVAPFCANAAPWPIGPVSPIGGQDAECVILFRMAANTLHNEYYEKVEEMYESGELETIATTVGCLVAAKTSTWQM